MDPSPEIHFRSVPPRPRSISPEVSPTGKDQRSILKPQTSQVHVSSRQSGSTVTGVEHTLEVSKDPHYHASSEDDLDTVTPGSGWGPEGGPYIDASSFFDSGRTFSNRGYKEDGPDDAYDEDGPGGNPVKGKNKKSKRNKTKKAPEQQITIFALRLALIEKGASGLGTLSFLWATVVILGGFATTVNQTDFWVVTLIILAESSRIFSRSHELEWQQLSVRSHEGVLRRFARMGSWIHFPKGKADGGTSTTRAGVGASSADSAPPPSSSPQSYQKQKAGKPAAAVYQTQKLRQNLTLCKTKDQTRTWNASSLQIVPHTHRLMTTKLVSRLLYAVQLQSAMMSIGLAIWRLKSQDFFYNEGDQQKPPNIMVSMNVFYILSVVEAGMFLVEKGYWEYKIRVKELLQSVTKDAELRPENLVAVKQFFYDVYSQCLRGSVFDGLEMDLVSFGISWLQADDSNQQVGGARLLNGIVSKPDGEPRKDRFAVDCLRRMGTTPGFIERLVEMLSWNSKHEQPLLSEVAAIICRLVVFNRNCSRIVAIPGSIEGITNLLLPHEWPNPNTLHSSEQTKAYLELRINGLRILKHLCKDHKNCLRIGEAKGLLSILIFFIEVHNQKAFEVSSKHSSRKDPDQDKEFFSYRLKKYKKSLQVIGLLAATTNTSGAILRSRITAVVSGLKNLRDMIHFGNSQPELQRLSVEILFHLAMDSDVRNTIGATGGIIRNLYDLFTSYAGVASGRTSSNPSTTSQESNFRKESTERQLASQMAGMTLPRIVLQNQKNCLKLVYIESESPEPFLKRMINFLMKPLKKPADTATATADEEIASCSAQILRFVINYVNDEVKCQVAEDSAQIVFQLIQQRVHRQRCLLFESYLGLAPRIIQHLNLETYSLLLDNVITKDEVVDLILRGLSHTPSTNKYPNIRRYSVELLIALINKEAAVAAVAQREVGASFLSVLRRRSVNLAAVLHDTLESISEVENFCLFSGLIGYAKHMEEMEPLVNRAIEQVEIVKRNLVAENHP